MPPDAPVFHTPSAVVTRHFSMELTTCENIIAHPNINFNRVSEHKIYQYCYKLAQVISCCDKKQAPVMGAAPVHRNEQGDLIRWRDSTALVAHRGEACQGFLHRLDSHVCESVIVPGHAGSTLHIIPLSVKW